MTPGIEKSGFLSVTEFVDTNTPISLEELYQVYKEFRHDGYIWGDVKKENVGILMRANTKYNRIGFTPITALKYFTSNLKSSRK